MTNGTPRRVIALESRNSIELELRDLLVDGTLPLYQHVEEKGLVFFNLRKGRITLSAGAYVGLIPLNPYLAIDVLPKLPVSNLSRVLEIARATLGRLQRTARTYLVAETPEAGVLAFIAANLVDAVREIEVSGYVKGYARDKQLTSRPRGRILMAETRSRCIIRGRHSSVVVEQFRQTADIDLNRIIKTALHSVLNALSAIEHTDTDLLSEVGRRFYGAPGEIRVLTPLEQEDLTTKFDASVLALLRPEYQRATEIALMVLNAEGVSLDRQGADRTLNSFILNLEQVVENYLRNSLRRISEPELIVEDGNKEGQRPLFRDRPNGPPAQPDIILKRSGVPTALVAEVKYKTKVNREDINQAITYAVTFATTDTVLVHIAPTGGKRGLYTIGRVGEVTVWGYAFDLSADDLEVEERALYQGLISLV